MNHTSVAMLIGVAVLATACGDSPTSPDSFTPPDGTYRSVFSAVLGPGVGGLSVTPVPTAAGTFDAIFKVRVEKARPNTTYYVQRAPEVGRPNGADGVCQRALALSPWSAGDPPAAAFVTFPQPALPGGLASFTTQPNGNGSIDFEYGTPNIVAGLAFDVMFRVVDDTAAPTAELRSGCLTVTAK